MTREAIPYAAGALGALVMPYNMFFHSAAVNRRWVLQSAGPVEWVLRGCVLGAAGP